MLINKTKRAQQHLERLPCIPLQAKQVEFIYHSSDFKQQIIQLIRQAKSRIYFTALYWQNDEAGQQILDEIYRAKQENPELDVKILVDWHRAQRNLLGAEKSATNADWYCDERSKYQLADDPNLFFGVPINSREVFGVLHIKGFVFDDTVLYSGASINNVYLHQQTKYRYDRYHKIENKMLADTLVNFTKTYLLEPSVVYPLDSINRPKTKEIPPIAPVSPLVLCFLPQSAVVIWGSWSPVRTRATAGFIKRAPIAPVSPLVLLFFNQKCGGILRDFGHP